ncbi:MAG TPA: ABC transporter permease [Victivallales bacterium]|nr:ABC transporter permease [Victivallales bacterium]
MNTVLNKHKLKPSKDFNIKNLTDEKLHKKRPINTQLVVFLAAVAMWIFLSFASNYFFTYGNIANLMNQMAVKGVIGVGVAVVIITGGIDLSIGSLIGVVNVVVAMLITQAGLPLPVAIFLVLILSLIVGLINGILVFDFKLPPFIATLGMMIVLRGLALLISNGMNISGLPMSIASFSDGSFIFLPNLFWILVITTLVIELVLRRTNFGRYVYALGSNSEAARLSGINTRGVIYGSYMICGLLSGVAGIMVTARTWQGSPAAGNTFELDAIACAVLGGASLMGAEGNAIGAFIGAMVMATIYNGCNLLGVDSNYTKVIVGSILIATVAIDQFRKRRAGK